MLLPRRCVLFWTWDGKHDARLVIRHGPVMVEQGEFRCSIRLRNGS
jgi:hypothetical protein